MILRRFAAMVLTFLKLGIVPADADVGIDWQGRDAGLVIDGPITIETTFYLGWASFEVSHEHGEVLAYVVNSPGGSVFQAELIAHDMYKTATPIIIFSGSVCASACFLLLAAARIKMISPDAAIGIHSARTPGIGEDRDALAATAEMAKQAAAYGIPDAIIGKLVRTPPDDLSVLTPDEIRTIPGATVAQSRDFRSMTKSAVPVDKYLAGYGAGAYIAAGKSNYAGCNFPTPAFQAGCLKGLRDAPPEGWARTLPSFQK